MPAVLLEVGLGVAGRLLALWFWLGAGLLFLQAQAPQKAPYGWGPWETSGEPGVERVQGHRTGGPGVAMPPGVTSLWAGFHIERFCLHHPQ